MEDPSGNQTLIAAGLNLFHAKKGTVSYQFEHLNYSENFNGNRHNILANIRSHQFSIFSNSSVLSNKSSLSKSTFIRSFNRVVYNFKKQWIGTKIAFEDNKQRDRTSDLLTNLSQRFNSYELFSGIGDSTGVFVEAGYKRRANDSLRANKVTRVNTSNTFYVKSKIIQNKSTNLAVYANFRTLKGEENTIEDENSLNSRLNFNQKLWNNLVLLNTVFETNSGTLAQQDFTYVAVEPGQGTYTWIDYNANGIQELNEFEVAQFADQGEYIRVLLPNQIFVKTHQNRFSQSLTINPQQWAVSKDKGKQFWSHFYNQTSYLVDRKNKRDGEEFNLNPFTTNEDTQLTLVESIRNVLFYNRGKQKYTTSYTYLSNTNRALLSIGFQENKIESHQFQFNHKFWTNWLINLQSNLETNESLSENFSSRNFNLDEVRFEPKLSYIFSENARFDIFYTYTSKDNTIGGFEQLQQNNYGISFTYNKASKVALTGEINFFKNEFTGNVNSPVAYQMLEGLQPGDNFTWRLLAQKKLTKFLDLNLNYFGRQTETSKAVHTGSLQLKAYF